MGSKDKTGQHSNSEIRWYSSNILFSDATCSADYMTRIAMTQGLEEPWRKTWGEILLGLHGIFLLFFNESWLLQSIFS